MTEALTSKAARHLRALGHDLSAVVFVGKEGVSDALVAATNDALLTHELIKVKVQAEAPVESQRGRHRARREDGERVGPGRGSNLPPLQASPEEAEDSLSEGVSVTAFVVRPG